MLRGLHSAQWARQGLQAIGAVPVHLVPVRVVEDVPHPLLHPAAQALRGSGLCLRLGAAGGLQRLRRGLGQAHGGVPGLTLGRLTAGRHKSLETQRRRQGEHQQHHRQLHQRQRRTAPSHDAASSPLRSSSDSSEVCPAVSAAVMVSSPSSKVNSRAEAAITSWPSSGSMV